MNCGGFGGAFRVYVFVLMLCLTIFWDIQSSNALSTDVPVNQDTVSTCVTCSKHEQLMTKLTDLKQSARVLSQRMEKVGTKLDDLEQCSCVQK